MRDLFDLISGTSTGSMLAGALSVNGKDSEDPLFWGAGMVEFYKTKAAGLFKGNNLAFFKKFMIWLIIFAFWGGLFFSIGLYRYANPKVLKA